MIDEQETLGVARALAGRYEQDYKSLDNRLSTFLCWLQQIGSELSMFPLHTAAPPAWPAAARPVDNG